MGQAKSQAGEGNFLGGLFAAAAAFTLTENPYAALSAFFGGYVAKPAGQIVSAGSRVMEAMAACQASDGIAPNVWGGG